jgi:hypothetical protein
MPDGHLATTQVSAMSRDMTVSDLTRDHTMLDTANSTKPERIGRVLGSAELLHGAGSLSMPRLTPRQDRLCFPGGLAYRLALKWWRCSACARLYLGKEPMSPISMVVGTDLASPPPG